MIFIRYKRYKYEVIIGPVESLKHVYLHCNFQ